MIKDFEFDVTLIYEVTPTLTVKAKNRQHAQNILERWVEGHEEQSVMRVKGYNLLDQPTEYEKLPFLDDLEELIIANPDQFNMSENLTGVTTRNYGGFDTDVGITYYRDIGLEKTVRAIRELDNVWDLVSQAVYVDSHPDFEDFISLFYESASLARQNPVLLDLVDEPFPPKQWKAKGGEWEMIDPPVFYERFAEHLSRHFCAIYCNNHTFARIVVIEKGVNYHDDEVFEVRVPIHDREFVDDNKILRFDNSALKEDDHQISVELSEDSPSFMSGQGSVCVRVFPTMEHNYRPDFSEKFNRIMIHAFLLGYGYVIFSEEGGVDETEIWGWNG